MSDDSEEECLALIKQTEIHTKDEVGFQDYQYGEDLEVDDEEEKENS